MAKRIYIALVKDVPWIPEIAELSAIRSTASTRILRPSINVTPQYIPWNKSESLNYSLDAAEGSNITGIQEIPNEQADQDNNVPQHEEEDSHAKGWRRGCADHGQNGDHNIHCRDNLRVNTEIALPTCSTVQTKPFEFDLRALAILSFKSEKKNAVPLNSPSFI